MDTRNAAGGNVDHQVIELGEYFAGLTNLGVSESNWEEVTEQLDIASTLDAYRQTYENTPGDPNSTAVRLYTLVSSGANYEDALAIPSAYAAGADPNNRERVTDVFTRAGDRARRKAWSRFKTRSDQNLDMLKPVFENRVEQIRNRFEEIPEGVTNLDQAARYGGAEAWLAIERHANDIDNISRLVKSWAVNNVIDTNGARPISDYAATMWLFEDFQAYVDTARFGGSVLRTAHAVTEASPKMLTITDIDRLKSWEYTPLTDSERNQAIRDEAWRNEQARKQLAHRAPHRVQ